MDLGLQRPGPGESERQLVLVVAGLLGPTPPADEGDPARAPVYPALETLLARGQRLPGMAHASLEAQIFRLFGIEPPDDADLPVAAVTRALDMGVIDQEWWLRADPVHLRPDRDRLILADNRILRITQEEANRLVAEVLEVFAADGWILKAPTPSRWYLKPRARPQIVTTPLPEVVGRDIQPFLPTGPEATAWHGTLNEVQILLHTAAVNAERERGHEPTINSLWFWGGGRLPELKQVGWTQVWAAEPVSRALARLAGIPGADPPAAAGAWLAAAPPGRHLVVLDTARGAVQYDDLEQWLCIMQSLETEWFAPLLAALRRKTLSGLTLYADSGQGFQVGAGALRGWWRRRQPLGRYR